MKLLTGAKHRGSWHSHDDAHIKGRPKSPHMSDKKSQCVADEQDHITSDVKFRDNSVNKMRQKERLISKQLKRENAEPKQEKKHFSKTHSSKSQGRTHNRRRRNDPVIGSPRKLPHPVLVDGPQSTFRGIFCHQVHPRSIGEIGCRSISVAKNKELRKTNDQSLHRNEVAEALVNQKLVNSGHFDDDRTGHKSKQFMEALRVLNSDKQLFSKLLDDPNSLLAKHIQELRDSQEKEQKHKSTIDTSGIQQNSTGRLSWKNFKRWGKHRRNSSEQQFSIVVLRPGQQCTGNIEKNGSSLQTNNCIRNEVPAVRQSHFPFQGFRRIMRNVTELSRTMKGQTPNFSVDLKKKGYAGEHNSLPAKIRQESDKTGGAADKGSDRDHKEGNFNTAEVRTHLSKPLSKDPCEKDFSEQIIYTTRRSLSLPEQDLLSFLSSGRTEEVGFFTAQMRLGSYSSYLNDHNSLWIHKVKEDGVASPPVPKKEVPMLNDHTCGKFDDPINHTEANTRIQEKLPETEMHEVAPLPIGSGSEGIPLTCELSQALSNQVHLGIPEVPATAETTNNLLANSLNPLKEPTASNYGPCSCANQSTSATSDHHKGRCICCFEMDLPLINQRETSSVGSSLLRAINGQSRHNVISSGTTVSLDRTVSEPADLLSVPGSPETGLVTLPTDSKLSNKADDKLGLSSAYVRSLLIASDFNWNELLVKCSESEQFLPPSLFGAIETQPHRSGIDCPLLFDYVDEILQEVAYHWYFRLLGLNTKMAPPDKNVACETLKWIDWNLVFQMGSCTLEQLIEKDLEKMQVWVDSRKDAEGIVSKTAESILEDIIEEMA